MVAFETQDEWNLFWKLFTDTWKENESNAFWLNAEWNGDDWRWLTDQSKIPLDHPVFEYDGIDVADNEGGNWSKCLIAYARMEDEEKRRAEQTMTGSDQTISIISVVKYGVDKIIS